MLWSPSLAPANSWLNMGREFSGILVRQERSGSKGVDTVRSIVMIGARGAVLMRTQADMFLLA